jgi:hypothetical protein
LNARIEHVECVPVSDASCVAETQVSVCQHERYFWTNHGAMMVCEDCGAWQGLSDGWNLPSCKDTPAQRCPSRKEEQVGVSGNTPVSQTGNGTETGNTGGPKPNGEALGCGPSSTRFDSARSLQIPLADQLAMYEDFPPEEARALMHQLIDEMWDEIEVLAPKRHYSGYYEFRDRMYRWSPKLRRDNILEEFADVRVYLTSGSIE